jgi:two-component system sensor histidine kinase KdpD
MAADNRPDPDALLARVQREQARARRGRLKVFFGAAAGVGKTYAMLSAAHEKRAEGVDVVVGLVETHGRAETVALLEGLERLPLQETDYRGTRLREFDLDAALKRRPALIIVDELAHSNAPGSRHPKRWNDVEELLDAGIDVYTAVNVQHLESLKDVVSGVTQIQVAETVPDTVFDSADEVELVDLPPDELLARLREGKVYMPEQAERAIRNFFRKGNLMALREMSLRRTAERVEEQMRDYRADQGIREVWQAGERILVCIGPGAVADRLVRAGRRLANALHAEWTVLYVETPALQRLPPEERDLVMQQLRRAEQLGALTATLSAQQMSTAILDYARAQNVTRIVLGKPRRGGWRRWLLGSVVDTLVREADDIGLHLVGGEPGSAGLRTNPLLIRSRAYLGLAEGRGKRRWLGYVAGLAAVAVSTLLGLAGGTSHELINVVMIYLLGVMLVAMRFGRAASLAAAALAVAAFDFFFIPPRFTFAVTDIRYLVSFAVMLLVGFVISSLTASLRSQARIAGYREKRAAALFDLTRELAQASSEEAAIAVAVTHIGMEFESQNAVLLPDGEGNIRLPTGAGLPYSLHGADRAVAQWVYDNAMRDNSTRDNTTRDNATGSSRIAGRGTDTLPGAEAVYFPLKGAASSPPLGVLAILPLSLRRIFLPEQQRLLETFLTQTALTIDRLRLADAARGAEVKAETESLRNSLLAGISHDLRTPLAAIVGAASSLAEDGERLSAEGRHELSRTIYDEAQRMTRLANNILDMARLESGAVTLNRDWYSVEEIVGSVLNRMHARLEGRPVETDLEPGLPLVRLDAVMMEQLLVNLIENALKYTPPGTPIALQASREPAGDSASIRLAVADRGPGIPAGSEERLFEKFYRATPEGAQSGVGLGLTICRAIAEAHGGRIWAENRPGGGARFTVALPLDQSPPQIEPEWPAAA